LMSWGISPVVSSSVGKSFFWYSHGIEKILS
jgi:hypothetical protein